MAKREPTRTTVSNIVFDPKSGPKESELVEFVNCSFSDISSVAFTDCIFKSCNFSNCKTANTRIQECRFIDCKLLGMNFTGVKDLSFEAHFEACLMDYSYFDKKNLNRSSFKNCRLHAANFSQADLSRCTFTGTDFQEAVFQNSNLSGLDLTTCSNLVIDPENNTIRKAKFRMDQLPGLLLHYDIQIE